MSTSQPVRTCVGCRTRRPQSELVRVNMDKAGRIGLSRTAPGRGAWLCASSAGHCLALAVDRKAFDRAFRRSPERTSVEQLGDRLSSIDYRA